MSKGSLVRAVSLFVLPGWLLWTSVAQANLRAYAPGSLIIPMDACYQAAPDQPPPPGCTSGKAVPDDGAIKAYGLVYQLLKKGLVIDVAIQSGKTAIDAPDLVIDGGAQVPVQLWNRASDSVSSFTSQTLLSYPGAPFLIDASEAATARALMASDPSLSSFTTTSVHVADITFTAPVAITLRGLPPRVALIDPCDGGLACPKGGNASSEGIPLMQAYLRRAGLDQAGLLGTFASAGLLGDVVTLGDIVNRDALRTGQYQIVWLPHYAAPMWNGTQYVLPPDDLTALSRLTAFVGAGGILLGQCAAVFSLEGGNDTLGRVYLPPAGVGGFLFTTPGATLNQVSACYPDNVSGFAVTNSCSTPIAPLAPPAGQALGYSEPANPYVQIGDFGYFDDLRGTAAQNTEGTVGNWNVRPPNTWNTDVSHLIASVDQVPANNALDMFSLARLPSGQVLYLGGHTYADPAQPSTAGMRILLNSLLFGTPSLDLTEEARSGTIVASDGKIYQGTFRESHAPQSVYSHAADAASWTFPQVLGHLREYPANRFTATETLGGLGEDWDAATRLLDGPSRTVYTAVGSGTAVSLVPFSTQDRDTFKTSLALPAPTTDADADGLITAVRAGRLGGIDHSTLALIPSSPIVPGGLVRPTVAYAGAVDGQLHAIAVSGTSVTPGVELWSFIPQDQLSLLRTNTAGVDADPNVRDLFDDWDASGIHAWRTYLGIPEGAYGTSVHAIDISNPLEPQLRWQRGTDTSSGGIVLGNARGATWSLVTRTTAPAGLVSQLVVASNLPSGQGLLVAGLSGRDGAALWSFNASYSKQVPGSTGIIPNDMPGPPAVVDLNRQGSENAVYVADSEGHLWGLDAVTGANLNLKGGPLFDVGPTPQGNVQPISAPVAVYRDAQSGDVTVLLATGGADWASPTDTYALYGVDVQKLNATTGQATLEFTTQVAGGRIYAAPTVIGNDVYVLSSAGNLGGQGIANLNDSGLVSRVNLTSHQVTLTANAGKGAGALQETADGKVIGATVRDQILIDNAGADTKGSPLTDPQRLALRAWLMPL